MSSINLDGKGPHATHIGSWCQSNRDKFLVIGSDAAAVYHSLIPAVMNIAHMPTQLHHNHRYTNIYTRLTISITNIIAIIIMAYTHDYSIEIEML